MGHILSVSLTKYFRISEHRKRRPANFIELGNVDSSLCGSRNVKCSLGNNELMHASLFEREIRTLKIEYSSA